MAESAFAKAFDEIMTSHAREIIIDEYCWMNTPAFGTASPEIREQAEAFYERLEKEGKVMDYLEATAAKPCPHCGRV